MQQKVEFSALFKVQQTFAGSLAGDNVFHKFAIRLSITLQPNQNFEGKHSLSLTMISDCLI